MNSQEEKSVVPEGMMVYTGKTGSVNLLPCDFGHMNVPVSALEPVK